MNSNDDPLMLSGLIVKVVSQVGCLISITAFGAIVLGLLLDQILSTKPLFLFILLLASVPLNIWLIIRYTRYKSKHLQGSEQQKEDGISE